MELKALREKLSGFHQEFDATQTFKLAYRTQSMRQTIVLDESHTKWREQSVSGSGTFIQIFDGQGLFFMDADGDEFVRVKRTSKEDPAPSPYDLDLDWRNASELGREPCGLSGSDHVCVTIKAPIKSWLRNNTSGVERMTSGVAQMVIDTSTGLFLRCQTAQAIDNGRSGYQVLRTYALRSMSYDTTPDATLFAAPGNGFHEVKKLTPWSLARVKRDLIGKPAPALDVTDIHGNSVSLAALKGKTVLLDFWTTWCPPCLADAPQLDKLYLKYRNKDLVIIAVSMSEERETVEKFLKSHPHEFPVVLTTENELPRPYQVGAFPTYMVVAPDGTLASVADGDQGFGELRKSLKKAGLDTE